MTSYLVRQSAYPFPTSFPATPCPVLERRVVARQAERDPPVSGSGDVGIEGEVLLHGVRVAKSARGVARFVQAGGAGQPEHDVHRARRPLDRVGAFEAIAGLGLQVGDL